MDLGEVARGEKMALQRTDPESYITECTLEYDNEKVFAGADLAVF